MLTDVCFVISFCHVRRAFCTLEENLRVGVVEARESSMVGLGDTLLSSGLLVLLSLGGLSCFSLVCWS